MKHPNYLEAARDLLLPGLQGCRSDLSLETGDILIDKANNKLVMVLTDKIGGIAAIEIKGSEIKDNSFKATCFPRLREAVSRLPSTQQPKQGD
jgi:hypothetical protein